MDNQHKHLKGYRDLTKAEIDLMNEIKLLEAETGIKLQSISDRYRRILEGEASKGSVTRELYEDRHRVHAHLFKKAHDEIMVAFMLFVRSIAQPQPVVQEGPSAEGPTEVN